MLPSQTVKGSDSGRKDDHRWTTLAALHPGVKRVVARRVMSISNGGRCGYRAEKRPNFPPVFTVLSPLHTCRPPPLFGYVVFA